MQARVVASLIALALAACGGAPAGISLSVTPQNASVPPSGSASFTATVSGAAAAQPPGVSWSVQEGTFGGTVDATGKYTAPAVPGTFHVVATSLDDTTKAGVATVTVSTPSTSVTVSISPRTASTALRGTVQFSAAVSGTSNASVTWSVQEGSSGGTVDSTGKYTAPASGGTYHVVATSVADSSKSDLATAVVVAPAAAMTLISRSVPATSSAGTASWGQDASYGGIEWGFHIADIGSTGTLVYDLSAVPAAQRRKILVALYMARGDPYYQLNYRAAPTYTPDDTPDAYVLEGSAQAAGPWTALVNVASNNNQYKTHTIADFSPYTFLRFRSVRAAAGCRVKMDVYDASAGVTDGIVFYGDSITTNIFQGGFAGFPPQWFSKQIQAGHPAFFPFVIGGGWPATTSLDGVDLVITASGTNFTSGLSTPLKTIFGNARYAALIWGANDAPDQTLVDGFRSHYAQIINALRAQGQVVILASPTWAPDPGRQAGLVQIRASIGFHLPGWVARTYAAGDYVWNGAHAYRCTTAGTSVSGPGGTGTGISDGGTARWSYVASLREDYAADSGVIPGPDLYSVFLNHPEWLVDGLHPNDAGEQQWRSAWVSWAGSTLYGP